MRCPFCLEDDFDLFGLKYHFARGYCDVFDKQEAELNEIDELRKEQEK